MHYYQQHELLKTAFAEPVKEKELPELGITIAHHNFTSEHANSLLLGSEHLSCKLHQVSFTEKSNSKETHSSPVESSDFGISSNKNFQFHIIQNIATKQAGGMIILFHGLNEKRWDKYLPWASAIAKKTNKAVVLFPIAFHMDRAPEAWSTRNLMNEVAQKRGSNALDNSECSYVNAAISSRLEAIPQRLFWSGLQSYSDIIRLVRQVRNGEITSIAPNATVDLFGYSIGSFLSMILIMANPEHIFSNSKLFCFCGGMTLDRMHPISKYIMDSRAAIVMQQTFATLLNNGFSGDPRLSHYMDKQIHQNESWFKSMLRYNYYQEEREHKIKELSSQIKSFVLKQDSVAPPIEALNTLKGGYRDITLDVQIEDFAHPYSHIVPFPLTTKNADEVDKSFELFTSAAADFFNH